MLHALLHQKLDESLPEPQRLEDALTSTVFGTLVWVDAWNILARWLRAAPASLAVASVADYKCWFWPRLAFAEPDVLLRLGEVLVLVEAKYRSGRHDLRSSNEEEESLGDQLVRQNRCLTTPSHRRRRYADDIESAIQQCRFIQVLVVDSRRLGRARREYEESRARLPPDTCLELVTWQRLFALIREARPSLPRWAADLRAYLDLAGLDTFEGIGHRFTYDADMTLIPQWRPRRAGAALLHPLVEKLTSPTVAALSLWRSAGAPGQEP